MTKHKTGWLRLIAVVAVAALVAAACGDDDSGSTTQATQATTTQGTTATTQATTTTEGMSGDQLLPPGNYKIGYVTLETGTIAFAGVPSLQAVQMAIDEANAAERFGPGVTLELVTEDGGGDQAQAIAAVELLMADDDIIGLICCSSSGVTGAIKPLIDAEGMPTVMVSAVLPAATEGPNMFRPKPPSASQYRNLGPTAAAAYGMTTAVVTRTTDNDGMVDTAAIMRDNLEASGVAVTFIDVLSTDTDMAGPATQIIELDPDGVFLIELASTLGLHARELRDRGYQGPIFGTGSTGNPEQWEIAGQAMVGATFALPYYAGSPDPGTQAFVSGWAARTGEAVPSSYAAEGYTAALMMLQGIENAGHANMGVAPTRDDIRAGLAAITELPDTPQGNLTFDANGQGDVAEMKLIQWSCEGTLVLWDGTADGQLKAADCDGGPMAYGTLKVGLLNPQTGVFALLGNDTNLGFDLYVQEQGGSLSGWEIQTVIEDDAGDPTTGTTKVRKLVEEDDVDILIGGVSSGVAYGIGPYVVESGVPYIITIAGADGLTQAAAAPNIYRISYTGSQPMHPLGEYTCTELGYQTATVVSLDFAFGWETAGGFARTYEAAGCDVVQEIYVPLGTADYAPFVQQISRDTDVVMHVNSGPASNLFWQSYRDFGYEQPVVGHGAITDDALLLTDDENAVGALTVMYWSRASEDPLNQAFVASFEGTYGQLASQGAEAGYSAAMVLEAALAIAGPNAIDPAILADAIGQVQVTTPRGPLAFDDYGQAVMNFYLRETQVVDGDPINPNINKANIPVFTFPDVSQFWTFAAADYLTLDPYADLRGTWASN